MSEQRSQTLWLIGFVLAGFVFGGPGSSAWKRDHARIRSASPHRRRVVVQRNSDFPSLAREKTGRLSLQGWTDLRLRRIPDLRANGDAFGDGEPEIGAKGSSRRQWG